MQMAFRHASPRSGRFFAGFDSLIVFSNILVIDWIRFFFMITSLLSSEYHQRFLKNVFLLNVLFEL